MEKDIKSNSIKTHEDLIIYQKAFEAAMTIFELSKKFPVEEKYSPSPPNINFTNNIIKSYKRQ